jgi:ubiquinone/menaquinone biosynthesis C-methylase UbiE
MPGFCEAARELNSLTGINILQGSALAAPVPDGGFDCAYSQAVLINISDKLAFLHEAFGVLRPGGSLALAFVGSGPAGEPHYQLPWAATPATSFLVTLDEFRTDLLAAGFDIIASGTLLQKVLRALAPVLRQLETEKLPPLGEHVVEWRINAMRRARDRRTSMIEALARKPI